MGHRRTAPAGHPAGAVSRGVPARARLSAPFAGRLRVSVLVAAAVAVSAAAQRQPIKQRSTPAEPADASSLYRRALPPYTFRFPRDHAAHPEYQTEWWYYTGHLYSGPRRFGYELTFFQVGIDPRRKASRSRWALHALYFAHFTVTDEGNRSFRFTEEVSRPALDMAGANTDRYRVWIHDWSAGLGPDGRGHRLQAAAAEFAIDLELIPRKPPVIHGRGGVSQKSAGRGRASHYYSLTRLETRGKLRLGRQELPVTGLSWMDHEFGSNQLTPEQAGWDWFSLQLDNNRELMLYVMRRKDGTVEPQSSGTVVNADGTWKHLSLSEYRIQATAAWKSRGSGAIYPAAWSVRVPGEDLELRLVPAVADQELKTAGTGVTYWEGSVRAEGRDRGKPVRGVGYVELTGYTGASPGI
jgi:predicted secreted hydrolase